MLKTELFDFSIATTRASIGTVRMKLNLWNSTDNTVTADPIDIHTFTEDNVKYFVEGETPETLAARWTEKMKDQINGYIQNMTTEQEKVDNVTSVWTTAGLGIDDDIVTVVK